MLPIYLDTHVLVRLYLGEADKLSPRAREVIEASDLLASPAAVLELEFLHEIGRLKPDASKVIAALVMDVGLRTCELPFHTVARFAMAEKWGHDPFDRLIVANAKARDAVLVTRDERIRQNFSKALW
jgi:PIN domain nuclease of toxin-antitoxin system